MKKNILLIIGVIVVVAGIFLGTNNNKNDALTFGVITGISGEYAYVGESFSNGVLLAQEEWNKENSDRQINIIVEDDKFDPKTGLSAYKKLADVNKVDGLINMTTFTIDVIADDVVSRNIPVAQGFIQTEMKDDNIVQMWPSATLAETKLGEYVKEKGYKNIALVVSTNSSLFASFSGDFKKGYTLPLNEIKIGSDISELRSTALKIKEQKPDGIVFIVLGDDGALLIKEVEKLYQGVDKPRYIFDANLQTTFMSSYGQILGDINKLNGSITYTVPINYTNEFTSKYKGRFNVEPAVGSDVGYNAFMSLARGYDSNKDKWVENMKKDSFEGADGKIFFDETGTRVPTLKIGTVKNGQLPK